MYYFMYCIRAKFHFAFFFFFKVEVELEQAGSPEMTEIEFASGQVTGTERERLGLHKVPNWHLTASK